MVGIGLTGCARALAVLMAAGGLWAVSAQPAAASTTSTTYTSTPTSSWTPTSGRVYALERVGDVIVLGGTFTSLRSPHGSVTQPRAGLAALHATTGELLPWNPGVTGGEVRALETADDGRTLYVGGSFTALAGRKAGGLGAVSLDTAERVLSFGAGVDRGDVRALHRVGGTLYLGGSFTKVNGSWQSRLAAVDAGSGDRISTFGARAASRVNALSLSAAGDSLVVGGNFNGLSREPRDYLGSVDLHTGEATPWQPRAACFDQNECYVYDLALDGTRVYAAIGGPGGQVRAYDAQSGKTMWARGTDGDVQAVALRDGILYAGGHFDDSFDGYPRAGIVSLSAVDGAVLPDFAPRIRGGTAVWDIVTDPTRLFVAGHFDTVDGRSEPGFTQFRSTDAPVPQTLVAPSSPWSYVDTGVAPGAAWTEATFDSSGWPSGSAELGFGDGDEATRLVQGHLTYWFRHTFESPDLSRHTSATISLIADDGAVVYVNGVEVSRKNMPAGDVDPGTKAVTALAGSQESTWTSYRLPLTLLRAGANVVAVEVHQSSRSSSDVSFDLRLDVE